MKTIFSFHCSADLVTMEFGTVRLDEGQVVDIDSFTAVSNICKNLFICNTCCSWG